MGKPDSTKSTVDAWRAAGEHGDAAAAVACFADDITLISPLTGRFRFQGRDQLRDVLTAAFEVITDIRYHTEVGTEPDTRALFYYGSCGGEQLEEAQLLRFNEAGEITELTLFGRPLPALTEVMKRLGPVLLRRQGRAGLARVIGAATAPLAAMTRAGDRHLMPLADPNRTATNRAGTAPADLGFEIEHRWKEEVIYWEGSNGFFLDAGWGVKPPVLYVPDATVWDEAVPLWLQGRRDEVVARLRAHSGHVLHETAEGYSRETAARTLTR